MSNLYIDIYLIHPNTSTTKGWFIDPLAPLTIHFPSNNNPLGGACRERERER